MTDGDGALDRKPFDPGLVLGVSLWVLFAALGLVSVVWTPYAIDTTDMGAALQAPGPTYWFGTDPLGRDVFSLIMAALLTSLLVAGSAVIVGGVPGFLLGLAVARWPGATGWISSALQGLSPLFPALIVAILLAAAFGASALTVIAALAIANVTPIARATRTAVTAFQGRGYVDAARLAGLSRREALGRHVLPQIAAALGAEAAMLLGAGVAGEAGLSYLGLGVRPPAASFGLLLADAQSYLAAKPLLVVVPGLMLALAIVASVLVARGLARMTVGDADGAA